MAKSDQKKRRQEEAEILELITNSLSEKEIELLVACSILTLDEPGLDRLVKRLGRETGETLRRLLEARRAGPDQPLSIAGTPKIRQEWEKAWSEWWDCIYEASSEEGKYIIHDYHWEPPYLDPYTLADDLEQIAVRMRKILSRVFDENLDPDFSFTDAIGESADTITGGLPDWMAPAETEGYPIGPEVTGCLLEWEWRAAVRDGASAFDFTDTIHRIETSTGGVYLNDGAITRFFNDLEEDAQKTILQGMIERAGSGEWAESLQKTSSHWFHVYQNLSSRWDRARYLESCLANISRDWRLAVPVAEDLTKKKAYSEAISVIEQGIRVMLLLGEDESWDPRETLLASHRGVRYNATRDPGVTKLLKCWRKAAGALGMNDLACALQLQETLFLQWENWDTALAAIEEVSETEFAGIRGKLFEDWRELVADESVGTCYRDPDEPQPTWVHSLIDAVAAGDAGPALFRDALRRWLEEIGESPTTLKDNLSALETLTLDLDTGLELRELSATLHEIITPDYEAIKPLEASRRRWLQKLNAPELFPEVVEFWKRNIAVMVPDPTKARGSKYDHCARWLSAVLELNPAAYEEIIREWSDIHRRRRNLWSAIAKRDLPVDSDS